jgi:hypothetical protein
MSVIPLKADIYQREWHVRYVPEAEVATWRHPCSNKVPRQFIADRSGSTLSDWRRLARRAKRPSALIRPSAPRKAFRQKWLFYRV